MAGALLFLGPSGPPPLGEQDLLGVEVLPPAQRGDIYRVLERSPRVIALADGVFHHVPAVLHKELLEAIDLGITVLGGASMGALRAAELCRFGMKGVGRIFRWYASGRLTGDDAVAILHECSDKGYKPVTFALVDLLATLMNARRKHRLPFVELEHLMLVATELTIHDRIVPNLLDVLAASGYPRERISVIATILKCDWVNQKHADFLVLWSTLRQVMEDATLGCPSSSAAKAVTPAKTSWSLFHEYAYRTIDGVSHRTLHAVAKLLVPSYAHVHLHALESLIMGQAWNRLVCESVATWPYRWPECPRWVDYRRAAVAFAQWWDTNSDSVEKTAIDAALSVLAYGFSARAMRYPTPFQAQDARMRVGGLPSHLIVECLLESPIAAECHALARDAVRANIEARQFISPFRHEVLSQEVLVAEFLSSSSLTAESLKAYLEARGFDDLGDLVYALRLTFAYRRKQGLQCFAKACNG